MNKPSTKNMVSLAYWSCVQSTARTLNQMPLVAGRCSSLRAEWDYLIAEALKTDAEHTQKLVYVCVHDEQSAPTGKQGGLDDTTRAFHRWCAAKRIQKSEHEDNYE